MEGQFQTSFIPKRPISQNSGSLPQPKPGIAFTVATIILIISILLAGSVFGYQRYLQSRNASLTAGIDTAVQSINSSEVQNLATLDNRISSLQGLLSQHLALSGFFSVLASGTLKSVQFTNFQYAVSTISGAKKITISMAGKADSFSSVALQAQTFNSSQYASLLQNPTFSSFGLDPSGKVTFSFTATLDSSKYSYASLINPSPQQAPTSTATTTTP